MYCTLTCTEVENFHTVHSVHCKWFTYPYSTNKCTVLLLRISPLISSSCISVSFLLMAVEPIHAGNN